MYAVRKIIVLIYDFPLNADNNHIDLVAIYYYYYYFGIHLYVSSIFICFDSFQFFFLNYMFDLSCFEDITSTNFNIVPITGIVYGKKPENLDGVDFKR